VETKQNQTKTADNHKEESEHEEEDDEEEVEGRNKRAKKNSSGSVSRSKRNSTNKKNKEVEELNCGAWLGVRANINDALFAVGGNDCTIRIISILHSRGRACSKLTRITYKILFIT